MYSELTGSEYGLVGYWKLNEMFDQIAFDSAGEYDGFVYGDIYWVQHSANWVSSCTILD